MGRLLSEIYDTVVSEKLTSGGNGVFEKIVAKYKKSDSLDDETDIVNDLSKLICMVQKTAFKAGVKAAVDVWNELCDEYKDCTKKMTSDFPSVYTGLKHLYKN